MSLDKQLVPVTFEGLDTKTAEKLVVPGKLLLLENAVRRKTGLIQKRNGFKGLGKHVINPTAGSTGPDGNISQGSKLAVSSEDLILLNTKKLYSYSSPNDSWVEKGDIISVLVDSTPFIRNNATQATYDLAYLDGLVLMVWEDSRGGSRMSVMDENNNASLKYDFILNNAAVRPKCIALESVFLITYIVGTDLYTRTIAKSNPSTVSAEQIVQSNVLDAPYDLSQYAGAGVFVINVAGPAMRIGYIYKDGQIGSPAVNGLPNPVVKAAQGDGCVTVTIQETQAIILIGYYSSTGPSAGEVRVATCDTALQTFDDALIEDVSALPDAPEARNITAIFASVQVTTWRFQVYYEIQAAGWSPDQNNIRVGFGNITTPGIFDSIDAPGRFKLSVGLAGKAFLYNSEVYVPTAYDSPLQATYFIIRYDGFVSAKYLSGLGGGLTSGPNGVEKSYLPNTYINQDGNYVLPAQVAIRLNTETSTILSANYGLNLITLTFDNQDFIGTDVNGNYLLAGGVVLNYDGVSPTEHGFYIYPEDISAAATGSGSIANGTYGITVVFEWIDGRGFIQRSAPAIPIQFTMTGGPRAINVDCPALRLTMKTGQRANVNAVVYRTTAGGTIYYRDAVRENDVGFDIVQIYCDQSDSDLENNEILYTTGGVLENIAPPACKLIVKHQNRVYLAGLEDGTTVAYSQQIVANEAVSFSDFLTFRVDSDGGAVTAIGSLDDKFTMFKKDRIFITAGTGPTATGAQNDFATPQSISSDIGCNQPVSIVNTPNGLMFKSAKGIYLLDRKTGISYVGAAVERWNTEQITSAVVIENTNEVRFTTAAGPALVYNYFFDQWSTFTNYSAVSATNGLGEYLHLKSDGLANRELTTLFDDNGLRIKLAAETSWLAFAGLQGYQRVYDIYILGNLYSQHNTKVQLAYNYEKVWNQTIYFDTSLVINTTSWGSDPTWGESELWGGDLNSTQVYQFSIKPRIQKCEALKIRIEDIDILEATGGACFGLEAMSFIIGAKNPGFKMPAGKTR